MRGKTTRRPTGRLDHYVPQAKRTETPTTLTSKKVMGVLILSLILIDGCLDSEVKVMGVLILS